MDSSFLTGLYAGLALFTLISFFKMLIQFGLPNHPARLVSYLVCACAVLYFSGQALVNLNFLSPWTWMKWRPLPIVAGSLGLLLQVIILMGRFSLLQQKIIARVPIMGALLCFAFFPDQAEIFMATSVLAGLILIVSVGKARYQKRLYVKMCFFLALIGVMKIFGTYGLYFFAEALMFFGLFYFFIFEKSLCLAALIDDFTQSEKGDVK